MNNTWLLIDASFLAWRAFHTTGFLKDGNDVPTGVAYGFLREIKNLHSQFIPTGTIFAFDIGKSKRREIYPGYKRKRLQTTETDSARIARRQVVEEIERIRTDYLPSLGFQNLFGQEGYEADDIIASVLRTNIKHDEWEPESIIVSADKDLYQLLSEQVHFWNPIKKELFTLQTFKKTYPGIVPDQWPLVKAIAGCNSDNIVGIRGVGESTAVKYLGNTTYAKNKAFGRIENEWEDVENRLKLVELPFPGLQPFNVKADKVKDKNWAALYERLGFKSLEKRKTNVDD